MKKNQGEKGNRLCDEMDLDKLYHQFNESKSIKFKKSSDQKATVSKDEKQAMF
jgi:hypothetical protein